jgi:hypothetical protein
MSASWAYAVGSTVTVESFLLVPFLLEGTLMVSLILERAARRIAGITRVGTLKRPLSLPDIHEALYWHPRHTSDPGHRLIAGKGGCIMILPDGSGDAIGPANNRL